MRKSSHTWSPTVFLVCHTDFSLDICNQLALISQKTSVWLLYVPREWAHQLEDFMFRVKRSMVLVSTLALLFTRYVISRYCLYQVLLLNLINFISMNTHPFSWFFFFNYIFVNNCSVLFFFIGCWWKSYRCCSRVVNCSRFTFHICYYSRAGVPEWYLRRARSPTFLSAPVNFSPRVIDE